MEFSDIKKKVIKRVLDESLQNLMRKSMVLSLTDIVIVEFVFLDTKYIVSPLDLFHCVKEVVKKKKKRKY